MVSVSYLSKLITLFLRLRGIEPRTPKEIIVAKWRKRYLLKRVQLRSSAAGQSEGSIGVVMDIDEEGFFWVELPDEEVVRLRERDFVLVSGRNANVT